MKEHQNFPALIPYGLLVSRSWLMDKNIERHAVDNWIKSGQLIAVTRGVFKRPDTELTWQGIVCSLQRMGILLTPGGLTALTMQGMAHYVSQSEQKKINLYGHSKLPPWVNKLLPEIEFIHHTGLEIDSSSYSSDSGFHLVPWKTQFMPYGYDKWPIHISSPELAILEVLLDVPQYISFEHADQLLQGMPNLSPQKLTRLLERCHNVKVKRLFLWLAEKHQFPWLKKLDLKKFSIGSGALGSGKRLIVKGGKLDHKYLITVPREMMAETHG